MGLYTVLKPCLKVNNTNITKNYLQFIFSKNINFFQKLNISDEISWNNIRCDLAV